MSNRFVSKLCGFLGCFPQWFPSITTPQQLPPSKDAPSSFIAMIGPLPCTAHSSQQLGVSKDFVKITFLWWFTGHPDKNIQRISAQLKMQSSSSWWKGAGRRELGYPNSPIQKKEAQIGAARGSDYAPSKLQHPLKCKASDVYVLRPVPQIHRRPELLALLSLRPRLGRSRALGAWLPRLVTGGGQSGGGAGKTPRGGAGFGSLPEFLDFVFLGKPF